MKNAIVLATVVGVAAAVAASAVARPTESAAPASVAQASCASPALGIAAPLTGPAAFLGQEQLSWSNYAVRTYNQRFKTKFKIVQGDTQLSASLARTVGRQLVSNKSVLGVIGPSTSQAVISSAGLFKAAQLAAVSGSATRTDLTTSRKYPTFFRVVPNDSVQAPSIVKFAVEKLKAKQVVVIDSQDDYSTALASAMTPQFRQKGVDVERESVAATDTDFSSLVTTINNNVDVVVFATQTASAAQTLSQQLREQGKSAVVFGTDGAYSPDQFKPRNGYVSSFAPDIRDVSGSTAIVRGYNRFSKNKTFGTFGPPSYMAAWVLMQATTVACRDGKVSRAEVTREVRRTRTPSILGGTIRFIRRGDIVGPKFFTFKITNGKYELAG
jgi:branched-chain amino acid transport system substrate-binding protein